MFLRTFPAAEILMFGAEEPRANIHAPNESVDLRELEGIVLAETLLLAVARWTEPARRAYPGGVTSTEPVRRNLSPTRVVAFNAGVRSERPDTLATEEPMEIRVAGPGQEARAVSVTMRTPGGDYELAVGFLFTEGLIAPAEVTRVAYCDDLDEEEQRYNVVTVTLTRPFDHDALRRNFYATSSCGICGKAALEDVEVHCAPVAPGPQVRADVLVDAARGAAGEAARLRAHGRVARGGPVHAAGRAPLPARGCRAGTTPWTR